MAKCVKKGSEIKRVSNKDAEQLVGYGEGHRIVGEGWSYCSRKEWKASKVAKNA